MSVNSVTDMSNLKPRPWGLIREHMAPGTLSSYAHCHLAQDEFAIMLEGRSRYWYQGITPEPILRPGDCIGWKAGTGICHNLLNDAEDGTGKGIISTKSSPHIQLNSFVGEDAVFLVWGENKPGIDKVYYPTSIPPWYNDSVRWAERPDLPQGSASSWPKFPRSEDVPYPS